MGISSLVFMGCQVCHGEKGDSKDDVRCDGNILEANSGGSDNDIRGLLTNPDRVRRPDWVAVPATSQVSAFNIFKTEVTNRQFASFLKEKQVKPAETEDGKTNDCDLNNAEQATCYIFAPNSVREKNEQRPGGSQRIFEDYSVENPYEDHPVTFVSWYAAKEYCNAVKAKLPNEAQWETALQGSDNRPYPWGNSPAPTCNFVNGQLRLNQSDPSCVGNTMNVESDFRVDLATSGGTVDVVKNGATPSGITHLLGNVSEWTRDFLEEDTKATDIVDRDRERIIKGGGWNSGLNEIDRQTSGSNPHGELPTATNQSLGFRCVE